MRLLALKLFIKRYSTGRAASEPSNGFVEIIVDDKLVKCTIGKEKETICGDIFQMDAFKSSIVKRINRRNQIFQPNGARASNFDSLVVCLDGSASRFQVTRFLTLAQSLKVPFKLILCRSDKYFAPMFRCWTTEIVKWGFPPPLMCSVISKNGLKELREYIQKFDVTVFLGPCSIGKTTLNKALCYLPSVISGPGPRMYQLRTSFLIDLPSFESPTFNHITDVNSDLPTYFPEIQRRIQDGKCQKGEECRHTVSDLGCLVIWSDWSSWSRYKYYLALRSECLGKEPANSDDHVWIQPTNGYIKVNVDASVKGNSTSIGGIFRDCNGIIIFAFAHVIDHCSSSLQAELAAIEKGINLSRQYGFLKVIIETDSAMAAMFIGSSDEMYLQPQGMLEIILRCNNMMYGKQFYIRYSSRKCNEVADNLANMGHQRCENDGLLTTLDASHVAYYREIVK